jgi:hypothetical protein
MPNFPQNLHLQPGDELYDALLAIAKDYGLASPQEALTMLIASHIVEQQLAAQDLRGMLDHSCTDQTDAFVTAFCPEMEGETVC